MDRLSQAIDLLVKEEVKNSASEQAFAAMAAMRQRFPELRFIDIQMIEAMVAGKAIEMYVDGLDPKILQWRVKPTRIDI